MNFIDNCFCKFLNIWNWHDCIELMSILTGCYLMVKWLERDRSRSLLMYIYYYGAAVILSYFLKLPTLNSMLIYGSPIMFVLAIVLHQESLQKNFVTPYKIIPANNCSDWLDELMQSCLVAININRQIICAIQHQDDLQSLLTTNCNINAPLQKTLMATLLNSTLFQENTIVWTTTRGCLVGINCSWIYAHDPTLKTVESSIWETACTVSLKTDALFFKTNSEKNNFDLVLRGNVLNNLTSNNCLKIIRQYVTNPPVQLNICSQHNQKGKHEEYYT